MGSTPLTILGKVDGPSAKSPLTRIRQFVREMDATYGKQDAELRARYPNMGGRMVSIEGHGLSLEDLRALAWPKKRRK